jgi:DNA-binding FadR family transcriptional regulator
VRTKPKKANEIQSWKIKLPHRSANLADQLYEQILDRIVTGLIPVDAKLPSETQLTKIFSVSRPVVREALARLQADEIVLSKHGAGTFVQRRPGAAFAQLAPSGDVASLMRCLELRIALEGEGAALAARRRTETSLATIERALTDLDDVIARNEIGVEADLSFHRAVALATQNQLFVQTLESISGIARQGMNLARSMSLRRSQERLNLVQREHFQVFEAIKNEDSEAARNLMRSHIENARTRILTDSIEP